MGRRGPKPGPTVVQLAKGDPGKRARRREGVEPMPEEGVGEPPALLDEDGRAMWEELVGASEATEKLVGQKWLTVLDRALLTNYCIMWSSLCKVAETIQVAPTALYETEFGPQVKVKPEFKAAIAAMTQMKGLAAEFGFSPSARARLNLGAKGDAAAAMFERFLESGKGA